MGADGFIQIADMTVSARYAGVLDRAGLRCAEELRTFQGGRDLGKANLASWRERIEITIPPVFGEATQSLHAMADPDDVRAVTMSGASAGPDGPQAGPLPDGSGKPDDVQAVAGPGGSGRSDDPRADPLRGPSVDSGDSGIGLVRPSGEPAPFAIDNPDSSREPSAERSVVLYMKRFVDPPGRAVRSARRAFPAARSLAGVEWGHLCALAAAGIPVPEPVALAERIESGRERFSALITARVPGVSLENWVARRPLPDRRGVRSVAWAVAKLVRRFHATGYVHRDLYLSHVFVDGEGSSVRLTLIDVARAFRPRWFRERWVVKDLAALHYSTPWSVLSRTDRVRWLKVYLGAPRLCAHGRRLIRRIVNRARRTRRHDQRHGRAPGSVV